MSLYPPPNDGYYPPPPPPPPPGRPPGPESIRDSPELRTLRSAYRSFGAAATLVSTGGFLAYVLLSSFAAGMLNQPLVGHLTIGLALGLCQFLVMGVTIWLYARHMSRRVDPVTHRLRARLHENEAQAQAQAQAQAREQQRRTPAGRRFGTW
ncbi:DUF485 domain-containing protein [Streptomyces ferrugineus]|uniref:DUF485 domain-containing protein n=1 Tax=Streptomyces ferrugineus TaxID=1413221 RepID=A0A7M2SG57_9ACTN|nr:DUF485 domain-containing protein [Streptomyces ferrugineus]QOV35337.1 DUF485 domain-containing protein [Streptomyces ferrugineus]